MEKKVLETIRKYNMLQQKDSVILGVSGGADSLCLLIVLNKLSKELGIALTAVHVNHHIRGEEADRDQKFVEDVCKKISVECKVYHIDANALAKEMKCSCEEAGRIARYNIFEKERLKSHSGKIAVAHNRNDSVETMLFNLCRGTGLKGITGILPTRDNIIRPLIDVERTEIEAYLRKENTGYCTDSTNLTDEYSRNVIRNSVLPILIEKINSRAVDNISKAGAELADIEDYIESEADVAYRKYVVRKDDGTFLVDEAIRQEHNVIVNAVIRKVVSELCGQLKDITRIHIMDIRNLLDKPVSKQVNLPYGIVVERGYGNIVLSMGMMKEDAEEKKTLNVNAETIIWDGKIRQDARLESAFEVKVTEYNGDKPRDLLYTKQIDCDMIKNRLVVRTRREGDYILIRGNDGQKIKKKLKQFFIDKKIPRSERDKVILIADGNSIVWIVGFRLSEEYKLKDTTKNVLELNYIGERYENN